jgi:cell wall-associated NlpC family hydrolase
MLLAAATLGIAASGLSLAAPSAAADAGPLATPSAAADPLGAVAAVQPTSATITADHTAVHPGDAVHLTGQVAPADGVPMPSQTLALQRLDGTAWASIAWIPTGADGVARYTLYPTSTVRLRVYYAGSATYGWGVSPATTLTVTPRPLTRAQRVLRVAAAQAGKWYRFGSAGPNTFDCSGLTLYAFRSVGVWLPHRANLQRWYGRAVSRAAARPGDLVIFLRGGYGYHAGIYAGGGYMYDAPHTGARVGKHRIWSTNVVFRRLV